MLNVAVSPNCYLYDKGIRQLPNLTDVLIPSGDAVVDNWYINVLENSSKYDINPILNAPRFNVGNRDVGCRKSGSSYHSLRTYPDIVKTLGFVDDIPQNVYITNLSEINNHNYPLLRLTFTDQNENKRYVCVGFGTSLSYAFTVYNDNTSDYYHNSSNQNYNAPLNLIISTSSSYEPNKWVMFYLAEYDNKTYLCTQIFVGTNDALYGFSTSRTNWETERCNYAICIDDIVTAWGNVDEYHDEPEQKFPEDSDIGGYYGDGDHTSDIIGFPPKPIISISNIGLINVYHPTIDGLQHFVNDLFPDIDFPTFSSSGDITEIVENIGKVGECIVKGVRMTMNEKLLDYVLDVHLLPVKPTDTSSTNIEVGYTTSTVSAPKILDDYIDFDCGTLNIKECYGNFIDYSCCRARLYLPFVGYVPIKNEYFLNGAISVKYRFNVLDGSFICCIMSTSSKSQLTDSVIGTYSGNCCVHVPISATSFSNVISGVVGGVSNMAQAISTGASIPSIGLKTMGKVAGAVSQGTSGALETVSSKPSLMLNNGYNATSSFLGLRTPYLIIERAVPCYPSNYQSNVGFPSYVTRKLSECTGHTECVVNEITTDGLADDIDIDEIKSLLNDYIIL